MNRESPLTTGCSRRCSVALRNAAEPERYSDIVKNSVLFAFAIVGDVPCRSLYSPAQTQTNHTEYNQPNRNYLYGV